jgi:hypothetical protein
MFFVPQHHDVWQNLYKRTCLPNNISKEKILDWPTRTDIHCWYDGFPFEGTPCSMPQKYDDKKKVWYIEGIFCSLSCVKSYIQERGGSNIPQLMRRLKYSSINFIIDTVRKRSV